jgi:hypothetical protein
MLSARFLLHVWPLFAAITLPCCGGRHFDVVRTATAQLTAGQAVQTLSFAAFMPLTIMDDVLLRQQGLDRGDLTQVEAHALTLTVLTPGSSQDLTFLTDVTVTITAGTLPPRTLATAQGFAAGENLVVLTVKPGDLLAYFSSVDPQVTVTATGQAPQDVTLRAELNLGLDVSSGKILIK